MGAARDRFIYHAQRDPHLRYFLDFGEGWEECAALELLEDSTTRSAVGVVAYPSGEILHSYGDLDCIPSTTHFMEGPVFQDGSAAFDASLVDNRKAFVTHGASGSGSGNQRYNYSTKLVNQTDRPIRISKFTPLLKGMFGLRFRTPSGYYSPLQFREWFRVEAPDGWIEPEQSVCDPDNWGRGKGIWAYFVEDDQGDQFIATANLENR